MSPSMPFLPYFRFPALRGIGRLFRLELEPREIDEDEDSRARRDFVLDMMDRHPAAFAGEYDVQEMMRHFPQRF